MYTRLVNDDSIVEVHALYGEFDLLARVHAEDSSTLSKMLMQDFRRDFEVSRNSNYDCGGLLR